MTYNNASFNTNRAFINFFVADSTNCHNKTCMLRRLMSQINKEGTSLLIHIYKIISHNIFKKILNSSYVFS